MNSLTVGENAPLWTFAGRRRFCSSISLLMNKPTNSFNLVVKEIESRAELRRHFVRGHVIKLLAGLLLENDVQLLLKFCLLGLNRSVSSRENPN